MKKETETSQFRLLLSTRQAGDFMGVSEERIREFTYNKTSPLPFIRLPGMKFPMYLRKDLVAYAEKHRVTLGN